MSDLEKIKSVFKEVGIKFEEDVHEDEDGNDFGTLLILDTNESPEVYFDFDTNDKFVCIEVEG